MNVMKLKVIIIIACPIMAQRHDQQKKDKTYIVNTNTHIYVDMYAHGWDSYGHVALFFTLIGCEETQCSEVEIGSNRTKDDGMMGPTCMHMYG